MRKIRNRIRKELLQLQIDIMSELEKSRKFFARATTFATAFMSTCLVCKTAFADSGLAEFQASAVSLLADLYNTSFVILTVAAGVACILAFGMRMLSSNPSTAAKGTAWLVRIAACYIGINCLGLIFSTLDSITSQHRWNPTSTT